jgi:hypothetical protein
MTKIGRSRQEIQSFVYLSRGLSFEKYDGNSINLEGRAMQRKIVAIEISVGMTWP